MPKRRRKTKPIQTQPPAASSRKKHKSQSREIRRFEVMGMAKGLSGPKLQNFVNVQMEKETRAKKKAAGQTQKPKRSKRPKK